jgi:hypothetical protein
MTTSGECCFFKAVGSQPIRNDLRSLNINCLEVKKKDKSCKKKKKKGEALSDESSVKAG